MTLGQGVQAVMFIRLDICLLLFCTIKCFIHNIGSRKYGNNPYFSQFQLVKRHWLLLAISLPQYTTKIYTPSLFFPLQVTLSKEQPQPKLQAEPQTEDSSVCVDLQNNQGWFKMHFKKEPILEIKSHHVTVICLKHTPFGSKLYLKFTNFI